MDEKERDMHTEELKRELPKGLIKWYGFKKGSKALFVSSGSGPVMPETDMVERAIRDAMVECGLETDRISAEGILSGEASIADGSYDHVVLAGALERSRHPEGILRYIYRILRPCGRLLMGTDNRLAIRYFCGDRDPFTENVLDGVEDYVKVGGLERERMGGRVHARAEIIGMLESAGFRHHRFYSVLPELARPQALYAEDHDPEGDPGTWIVPQYRNPETIYLEEERLYAVLIRNGLFHAMANGYFVECPKDGTFEDVKQVTISMERGRENALATVIRRNGRVEKRAMYAEGHGMLQGLLKNSMDLEGHGVRVVDASLEEGLLTMPYLSGESATDYFRRLLVHDRELFFHELDRFWNTVRDSSEQVPYDKVDWEHFDPDWKKRRADDPERDRWERMAYGNGEEQESLGVILERGYMNLFCGNCIHMDGEFIFYSQGFFQEQLPAFVLLMRTIDTIYAGRPQLQGLLPQEELLERYHLDAHRDDWRRFFWKFMDGIRHERELASYHRSCRRDGGVTVLNRFRMNYSENEYERCFKNIFQGIQGRKLYLFGSGIYAEKFLEQFDSDYQIEGILDNDSRKWGTELSGIRISSPEFLRDLPEDSVKVIICVKKCTAVMRQLRKMGIANYSVYDWRQEYPRKMPVPAIAASPEGAVPKKYRVGYIAGVFDMFHIGHLNMFRRAKEQCDHLIVGVVTDEGVRKDKKTMPVIPFEERLELVRSCRYVDEAVEIPVERCDTDEAYRRYHFDVQFSGSDHADDPGWLAKQDYLRKRGSDLVFFPYTQATSSTKLKELIERRLL